MNGVQPKKVLLLFFVMAIMAKCSDNPDAGKSMNLRRYESCIESGQSEEDCRAMTGAFQ